MTTTRREFIKTVGAAIASSQIPPEPAAMGATSEPVLKPAAIPPQAAAKRKVIYDQDNSGPFGTDILGTLMMLQADNIDLLGITLVTGDAWMKQEMAFTLRLLEMMGRTEIPVYAGAEFPMLNTKEEWLLRLQLYGGHRLDPWMGAFNRTSGGPEEIKPLPPPYDRFSKIFNIFFDPEAARKVLRARWPKLSIVTVDIAEEIHEGDEIAPGRRMIEEIVSRAQSPISDLFQRYAVEPLRNNPNMHLFRMADEMVAAQVIDPSVFTKSEHMYVDICSTPGPRYGDSMFWPKNWQLLPNTGGRPVSLEDRRVFVDPRQFYLGPPPSAGLVNVLLTIDHDRFKKLFVDLMTKPIRGA